MVADIDISLSLANVFPAVDFVRNKIELAESPRPEFEELVADRTIFLTKHERQQDARQVHNHKKSEDKQHPGDVQLDEDGTNKSQRMEFNSASSESFWECRKTIFAHTSSCDSFRRRSIQ